MSALSAEVRRALARDRTIDIVTTGRKSGRPRRIEIWFLRAEGRIWLTGTPGPRGWYANLRAEPHFTFCLKESLEAELEAHAVPIENPELRRRVFAAPEAAWYRERAGSVEALVAGSPLVEVVFPGG